MAFQKLDDIEIDGVKITNIYRECEYYFRTSGYNYAFYFHCDLTDNDAVYDLCKKAFPEGKNLVEFFSSIPIGYSWNLTKDVYKLNSRPL